MFDQFRGDYLDRYSAEFKAKNGWDLFLSSAHASQTATTIMPILLRLLDTLRLETDAYKDRHQIPTQRVVQAKHPDHTLHQVSSVPDERYKLVGAPAGTKDLTGCFGSS
jgi:hypothetical protein